MACLPEIERPLDVKECFPRGVEGRVEQLDGEEVERTGKHGSEEIQFVDGLYGVAGEEIH
jgi:hypothetical protein